MSFGTPFQWTSLLFYDIYGFQNPAMISMIIAYLGLVLHSMKYLSKSSMTPMVWAEDLIEPFLIIKDLGKMVS